MSEEKIYPSMVIRSQAEAIELLEKENQQLKEENDYYFKKNIELSTLNTSLRSDRDLYKEVIEEAKKMIEKCTEKELNYITYKGEERLVCGSDFGEGADIIWDILNKAKED